MMASANVKFVQLDSLVVMKIVKHVETEQHTGMSEVAGEACQGFLTGLVAMDDHRLEITNCFPTARTEVTVDDEGRERQARDLEDVKQSEMLDMLRKFRNMNIDYELVGFYQAHPFGACFTADLVESLVDYQSSVVDGVVLIYDPVKTRQGQLSLRAYRLSAKALDLCYVDWSPETVKQAGLTFENMFEELPIVIKNSHLVNVMLSELSLLSVRPAEPVHLQLGAKGSLEKCMRGLMNHVDDLNRSINSYNKYAVDKARHDALISNLTQKRQLENETRRARGEPALPMDDIKKMKAPTLQSKNGMLECFLAASETAAHVDHALEVSGENIAKLFLAEAVAEERVGKERSGSAMNVTSSSTR